MVRLYAFLLCALLLPVGSLLAAPPDSPAGKWQGALTTPGGDLVLILTVEDGPDGRTAVLESPDQAPGQKIPVVLAGTGPDELAFDVPAIRGSFAASWDDRAGGWAGNWSQSGYDLPLTLRAAGTGTAAADGLAGTWQASVERAGQRFRLVLRIGDASDGPRVRFDAPDAGAHNLVVELFERNGDRVSFAVPNAGAAFEGSLSKDGARLDGRWSFPGRPTTEVSFERVRTEARAEPAVRPQTPAPPFPYRAEQASFANPQAAQVMLAGTLTLPAGPGPFPAAVLITGSGAQDRNETLFGHKPFAVLADHLTRSGIAVLRYDDRGVDASTGDFAAATTADFAADAQAAHAWLAARPETDANAVGLIGHSEGGLVAAMIAAHDSRVAFVVLLAAPGTPMRQLLLDQHRLLAEASGGSADEVERSGAMLAQVLDRAGGAESSAAAAASIRSLLTDEALMTLGAPPAGRDLMAQQMSSDWMRALLRIDPRPDLAAIRVPVLALDGSLDLQVAAGPNLAGIRAATAGRPDVTVRELPGLNHLFQTARTGSPAEYPEIEETMAPIALAAISDWIEERFVR